jgi:hypothetical protein
MNAIHSSICKSAKEAVSSLIVGAESKDSGQAELGWF